MFKPPSPEARRCLLWVVALAAIVGIFASGAGRRWLGLSSYEEIYLRRFDRALKASSVNIAVVYSGDEQGLFNGVDLAFRGRSVTVRGKPLPVILHPFVSSSGFFGSGEQVEFARTIARDDRYVAVLGHSNSRIASMASVSYEYTQLLFLSSGATDPMLTQHGFGYVVRSILTDRQYIDAMAQLCNQLHVSRVGVFYQQSADSLSALDELEDALTDHSISTLFEKSYEGELGAATGSRLDRRERQARLRDQIAGVEHLIKSDEPPQMIALIGDNVPAAVEFWSRFSHSDLKGVPVVIYSGPLDSASFLRQTDRKLSNAGDLQPQMIDIHAGDLAIEPGAIYAVSLFSAGEANEKVTGTDEEKRQQAVRDFISRYRQQFNGIFPDGLAFRGFTAGEILKSALAQSDSIAPVDVQETLKSSQKKFESLGRVFTFDVQGDASVKRLGADTPLIFKRFSPREAPQPRQ